MRSSLRRLARPDRVRASLTDAGGGMPLPLASRRTRIPGLAVGLAALVVASIAWQQSGSMSQPRGTAFGDLLLQVLRWSWVLGLWLGALVLVLLTVVLLFYRESARLADTRLVYVARLGPVHVSMDYELAEVRNLRAVSVGGERARVCFDYGQRDRGLGADMPTAEAEARVKMIQASIDGLAARRASQAGMPAPRPTPSP